MKTSLSSELDRLPPEARGRLRHIPQPTWFPPMLATLAKEPFSREGWLFERKLDGERCLAFRHPTRTDLFSRNRILLTTRYPEIAATFSAQNSNSFIADGEIVAFEDHLTSFSRLQQRMGVQNPSPQLCKQVPVWFYAFDLLYVDGWDLRDVPLRDRKVLLNTTLTFGGHLRLTERRDENGEAYFQHACSVRWEGIIAKDGDSEYISQRSRQWLKIKCVNEQEFVVGGFTDPQGHRLGFGALLIGYYDHGRLHFAGKVGTGYDSETLNRLAARLVSQESPTCPFTGYDQRLSGVHWVHPRLVAQIGFAEWTGDGKLRHPRYLGLRDDKSPEEVRRES